VAAGISRAAPPGDRGTAERTATGGEAAHGPLEELLGRTSAELDAALAELALSAKVRSRLEVEVERLEQRLRDAEGERRELREKLDHRDRLLGQVFGSRSWRWTQAVRRLVGRP